MLELSRGAARHRLERIVGRSRCTAERAHGDLIDYGVGASNPEAPLGYHRVALQSFV
jgi:hypothetical protein